MVLPAARPPGAAGAGGLLKPKARLGDELADVAQAARRPADRPRCAAASRAARPESTRNPRRRPGRDPAASNRRPSRSASRRASCGNGHGLSIEHGPAPALFRQMGQVERQAVAHVDAGVQFVAPSGAAGPRRPAARNPDAGPECCRRRRRVARIRSPGRAPARQSGPRLVTSPNKVMLMANGPSQLLVSPPAMARSYRSARGNRPS